MIALLHLGKLCGRGSAGRNAGAGFRVRKAQDRAKRSCPPRASQNPEQRLHAPSWASGVRFAERWQVLLRQLFPHKLSWPSKRASSGSFCLTARPEGRHLTAGCENTNAWPSGDRVGLAYSRTPHSVPCLGPACPQTCSSHFSTGWELLKTLKIELRDSGKSARC